MSELPQTQCAVQLAGTNELILNESKPLVPPGPHQIVCRIEAVGLCFSDLKLVRQFASHPRKMEITGGIDQSVLREVSSYVPGNKPTVPGHETVVRIEAVGKMVEKFEPGQRYLVETDYRWLPTAQSNGSFGYNFEGALQQYVLMDERVITSPAGESMLIPVPEHLSASAAALIEPWACVENSYAGRETRQIKPDSRMSIVADMMATTTDLMELFRQYGRPGKIIWASQHKPPAMPDIEIELCPDISRLPDAGLDDVTYLGSNPDRAEALLPKLAPCGLLNIVLCGYRFKRDIRTPVGRIHYTRIRITGTTGYAPAEAMKHIPQTGEIRRADRINIIGAAGPMGAMHVIRNIGQGIEEISIFAGDTDDSRLAAMAKIAEPMAKERGLAFKPYNPAKDTPPDSVDYTVIMVPSPDLAAASIQNSAKHGIINIFAGLPADASARTNLDEYIEKQLYFTGTSGSNLEDMKLVLEKATSGRLNTNVSVAAVCGLDGVFDGLKAIENHSVAGKIIVYPACKGLSLTPLAKLKDRMPEVAACLDDGLWTAEAEQKLLERYTGSPAA